MTFSSLVLITAVALVNLMLGFGVAVLFGRGPCSARGRHWQTVAALDPTANECAAITTESEDVASRPVDSQATEGTAEQNAPSDTISPQVSQTLQRMATGIESIEQSLHELQHQIQTGGENPDKQMFPQWAAGIIAQTNQLGESHEDFRLLVEQESLAEDIVQHTLSSLDSLQEMFQQAVLAVGQRSNPCAIRSAAVERLLSACQEVRGSVNAASFFKSQP